MDKLFDPMDALFSTPRKTKKLKKYAILLNEPNTDHVETLANEPCGLAEELLPLQAKLIEDLVQVIGDILISKIKAHAEITKVSLFKADEIINKNAETLVPVMYRIATEEFVKTDKNTFKIIECRNATKLISDWKPSLPDLLISLGHQVIVVQLEESFVPYTDFAYAILRQLNYDWKNRLPRSFFFPDDVCKVDSTSERDLCVVSPSMPDGDLEINKKMGLLNYELLMMIKSSCMSAMKNYLMKRDLRVGKFSDTLDGVSALRQLYRRLQERLKTGQAIQLRSNSLEDLRKLMKESIGGPDVLAAQTWIEYGKRMGLDIPASTSSSATSISLASNAVRGVDGAAVDDDEDDDTMSICSIVTTSSSSGFDKDDGKDCQDDKSKSPNFHVAFSPSVDANNGESERSGLLTDCGDDGSNAGVAKQSTNEDGKEYDEDDDDDDEQGGSLKLEDFTEFKDSLERKRKTRDALREGTEEDHEEFSELQFSADSILQILRSSQ
ncbi:hypothetical protein Ocin01_07731 [Orchesella cincta]|uniref:Uncharacterized protein n=1 Tax=Orchesella cincta TaxID=48709 RepID=A0A1D2N164_ORCCI|nr:hypothetical protein Ocin01_07731 [Orchesella cincta]